MPDFDWMMLSRLRWKNTNWKGSKHVGCAGHHPADNCRGKHSFKENSEVLPKIRTSQ